jgi:hypothetical protein
MVKKNVSTMVVESGGIICQFLLPGGSMVPRFYNINLVKNPKIANNSTTTKAREKISIDFWNP